MKRFRQMAVTITAAIFMIILMTHTNDTLAYATDAIRMCCVSLIPSLFPFIFLAILLSNACTGFHVGIFGGIRKICRIPKGGEILFVLGLLGGYPIGAQVISNAYHNGNVQKEDAKRMLGFCNNAGPAFIFGILGPLFHSGFVAALLWFIQILSAIFTGILLKGGTTNEITVPNPQRLTISEILERSVKTIALICGWVMLFKISIGFANQYLLIYIPDYLSIIICGLLELTNGCLALQELQNPGACFVLSSLFLSAGGLCVALQTSSVVKTLGIKTYIAGKCIQSCISVTLAYFTQHLIFQSDDVFTVGIPIIGIAFSIFSIIIFQYRKKQ